MRKIAIAVVLGAAMMTATAGAAKADVAYAPYIFNAKDAAGNIIADGTYVMVIDLDNNGWGGVGYTQQSPGASNPNANKWLWDSNDVVIDRGQITNGEAFPFSYLTPDDAPAGYAPGESIYVLWFNKLFSNTATGPGANVAYGAANIGLTEVINSGNTDTPDVDAGSATLTTVAGVPSAWHNNTLGEDVNGDGVVSPLDALLIINKLHAEGSHLLQAPGDPLPPHTGAGNGYYWDVTDDTPASISSADALQVIAVLNGGPVGAMPFGSVGVVPEPASIFIMLAGGGLLACRRRSGANA